jgi:hypothetical protein
VANESSGDGSATPEFAEVLGMSELPSWGDSTEWQYWVIDTVKRHEADRGYEPHPIGMTMQFPVADQPRVNEPLLRSGAEWISPGYDDEVFAGGGHPMAPGSPPSRWYADPPAADGSKVVISDTDHYAPGSGDALWAWKSFLRGHHPILMDFGLIGGLDPGGEPDPEPGVPPFEFYEPARWAMGDTRRYAERMNLIEMEPRGDLSSTGYALANPGEEYLVLEPDGDGRAVTVELAAGQYSVEWFNVASRDIAAADRVTVGADGRVELAPPWPTAPRSCTSSSDGPATLTPAPSHGPDREGHAGAVVVADRAPGGVADRASPWQGRR